MDVRPDLTLTNTEEIQYLHSRNSREEGCETFEKSFRIDSSLEREAGVADCTLKAPNYMSAKPYTWLIQFNSASVPTMVYSNHLENVLPSAVGPRATRFYSLLHVSSPPKWPHFHAFLSSQ